VGYARSLQEGWVSSGPTSPVGLLHLGADVTIVDSLIPEYGGNFFNIHDIRDRVSVNITDVRDSHAIEYLVQNKDYVFNLAGQTSHLDSMLDPKTDLDINAGAQLSILEACRKHNRRCEDCLCEYTPDIWPAEIFASG
jgi:nucleoside-diphosphate-sugar epimerase